MSTTRRPSQADIAQRLGVSVSTVSRALTGEPGISQGLRREVQALARDIGYRPKRGSAANGPSRRVVALFPLRSLTGGMSGFYEGIVAGMRAAATAADIDLDVRLVGQNLATPEQVGRHLSDAGCNSLLLAGIDPSDELAAWCLAREVDLVLVNGSDPKMRFSSVSPSNFYGGRLATEQLLAAGHRHIAHVTYQNRYTIFERTRGFEAAIAGCPGASGHLVTIGADRPKPDKVVAKLLAEHREITALFCMNDLIAVDILESSLRRSRPLPESFSVMGFDDLPIAGLTSPRLSTVRVDREAIGHAAIRLMRQRLDDATAPVEQVELGLSIVPGATIRRRS